MINISLYSVAYKLSKFGNGLNLYKKSVRTCTCHSSHTLKALALPS